MMDGFKEKDKGKRESKYEVLKKEKDSSIDEDGLGIKKEDSSRRSVCSASPIVLSEEQASSGGHYFDPEDDSVGSLRSILKKPASSNCSSPGDQWPTPRVMGRGRYFSESCVDLFSWGSRGEYQDSHKKSVHFSETVRKQIYRANASILGQSTKNKKKAEKKRKSAERRKSEGDERFNDSGIDTSINCEKREKSSLEDSGLSSSLLTESEGEHSLLTESEGELSVLTESEGELSLLTESEGECELVTTLVKSFSIRKVSEASHNSVPGTSQEKSKEKSSQKYKRKEKKGATKEEGAHEPLFNMDI